MAHPLRSVADDEIRLIEIVALVFAAMVLLGALLAVGAPRSTGPVDNPPPVSLIEPDSTPSAALSL
jgi:hypothetical protein